MIRALVSDAARLLLRPIPLVCLVVVGALLGSLVAATRHSLHGELAGLDERGASVQSLLSGLALFVACSSLVLGLLLGHEDRTSGFVSQLAMRPVSRFQYVIGRGVGIAAASLVATLVLVIAAVGFSGISPRDLPELKSIRTPTSVVVDGRPLASGDVTMIARGQAARFRFEMAGAFAGELRIEPRISSRSGDEEAFSGFLDLTIRAVVAGEAVHENVLQRVKPVGSIALTFSDPASGGGEIVIENRTPGASLVIAHDSLRATGATTSATIQTLAAALLLAASGVIVALMGFACATAFSIGPAALTAGFLLLVALAKATVLELAVASYPKLVPLIRLAPDLARFDSSESFGRGEALTMSSNLSPLGAAGIWIVVLLCVASLALSWRDR